MKTPASKNKAALITGAAQRIGAALALCLAREGYDIALHYFRSEAAARRTARAIEGLGRRCKLYRGDLRGEAAAKKLVTKAFADFPGCELLVNNASSFKPADFLATDAKLFDENMDLHVKAPFFLSQCFALRCKRGLIVNLVDAKVRQNKSLHFAYLLSKKSLLDLTRMSALALAPGIRVNAIAPGAVLPPEGKGRAYLQRLIEKVPLKKQGSLEDLASALLFLIRNEYITGQCLHLDGGSHLL